MSTFRFQQFSVCQKQSAMKVCTDALLFGAMMPVKGGERVLDIGTGTGLLSLLAAQLGAGEIRAVELTLEAYREAQQNFKQSPWHERLEADHQSIQDFAATQHRQYDLILCNPPFFENHRKSEDALRKIARHNDDLSFKELIEITGKLMAREGLFYLLLPAYALNKFSRQAYDAGLYLIRQTDIRSSVNCDTKISALTFSRSNTHCIRDEITVYRSPGVYTEESQAYLSPFLLRFAKKVDLQGLK